MESIPISIPYPNADDLHLKIALGACKFEAMPGTGSAWVSGTVQDPTGRRAPQVLQEDGTVRITEGEHRWEEVDSLFAGMPHYQVTLGRARPFALTIETGASEFELDLGGVPIRSLVIKQGAGKFDLKFSEPNPQPMNLLEIGSGAARLELEELGNANFGEMKLSGGAAGYKLDFGGTLQRAAQVKVTTGLAGVEIRIPATTAAQVICAATLGGIDVGGGFVMQGGALWTEAALAEHTLLLTIDASVSLGGVQLRSY